MRFGGNGKPRHSKVDELLQQLTDALDSVDAHIEGLPNELVAAARLAYTVTRVTPSSSTVISMHVVRDLLDSVQAIVDYFK